MPGERLRQLIYKSAAVTLSLAVLAILSLLAARIIHAGHEAGSFKQKKNTSTAQFRKEIHPGTYKATLVLSNGQPVALDSSTIGLKPMGEGEPVQMGIDIISYAPNLLLVRNGNRAAKTTESSHTLRTPRGGMFSVVLPDGSKVWLNNESSLKYPVHFKGPDRRVALTGEANFTVVKDPSRPFMVTVYGNKIKALGTQFTVTAYTASIRTVLQEGRVEVAAGSRQQLLEAGQQLDITNTGAWKVKKAEDVGSADAWTRGLFYFRDMTLTEILRSLARWYDVDLDTSLLTTDPLRGAIKFSRSADLKDILSGLEDDKIHIRLRGNTIVASYR